MNKKQFDQSAEQQAESLKTEESWDEKEQRLLNLMTERFSTIRKTLGEKAAQTYIDTVESEMQKHYQSRLNVQEPDLVSDLVQ